MLEVPEPTDITLSADALPLDLIPPMKRSPGKHVSEILRRICIDRGMYEESTEIDQTRLVLGQAFEKAILEWRRARFPNRYVQIGEMCLDGIYGNMDDLDIIEREVSECKCTWRSAFAADKCDLDTVPGPDHPIRGPQYWKDWAQVMAYCKMSSSVLKTPIYKGRLMLCHVQGDYREFKVVYREWTKTFSQTELNNNWLMIKHY